MYTGGEILVESLLIQGVDRAYCVPGESFLAVLDAVYDRNIEMITCRQECGAAMMAEAYGKLTGQPGICFVTRGPGATNAAHALHIAKQDSTPLVLFVGQVRRDNKEREGFQEIDYNSLFAELAKWVVEINDPQRIPEFISRAFRVATSGRPGVVVISLPEDMLREKANFIPFKPYKKVDIYPGEIQLKEFWKYLQEAKKPLLIVGGSGWNKEAVRQLQQFSEKFFLPVACSFRRQQLFSHNHSNYIGDVGIGMNPELANYIKECDLLLLFGCRFGEIPSSGYELLEIPQPKQKLIHVHPDSSELGRVYNPDIAINATMPEFLQSITSMEVSIDIPCHEHVATMREIYLQWSTPPRRIPGDLQMGEIINWLNSNLSDDTIICNGAGNYSSWVHRYYKFCNYNTQLAPTSGSMGYGVPAAVAAKQLYPEKTVIAFAGDGCFLMNGQEFATAVQYSIPIIVLIINNGMYGTIRMHQENNYPGRISATSLQNPDFAAYAKAFGGHGETVQNTQEFYNAYSRCIEINKPAIIELRIDSRAITPTTILENV